jgi:hypothetical protein
MGGWGKVHNKELCHLYSLPRTIRVIGSRRMRWAGHVAQRGQEESIYVIGKKARRKIDISRQIILSWILM